MTTSDHNTPIIKNSENLVLTSNQWQLLEEAYQAFAPATLERNLTLGKSGAKVYLMERNDHQLEVVKFDHPYKLRPELKAYNELVGPLVRPQYRVTLRGKQAIGEDGKSRLHFFESQDGQVGALIYNFLGEDNKSADDKSADDDLLKYYNDKGGTATAEALQRVFDNYGAQWWNTKSQPTICYGEEYDRLLPVHFTLQRLRPSKVQRLDATRVPSLQSGKIDWGMVRDLGIGQVVQLQKFEITECSEDEDILSLCALPHKQGRSTVLRIKLAGLLSDQHQPGQTLPDTYAEIKEMRVELLEQAARKSTARFTSDGAEFILQGKRHTNPLAHVDDFLSKDGKVHNTSIIHGDLNLRNIMVHQATGFVWLIDFAHTRRGGPTLLDLQRLEEHVITQLLAPLMEKRNNANDLVRVFNALHRDPVKSRSPVRKWRKAFTVLQKIREIAKKHLSDSEDWNEYYQGLFLVFMGALKYDSRTHYQCDLLLVGAATVKALMDKKPDEVYKPVNERLLWTWPRVMVAIAPILVCAFFMMMYIFNPGILETTASDLSAISGRVRTLFTPLQNQWPPQNGTILARVRARGFLICGISGDIQGFSHRKRTASDKIDENLSNDYSLRDKVKASTLSQAIKTQLYDQADGLDTDYCRALAIAVFGQSEGYVAFQTLILSAEKPENETYWERFQAVQEGIVDVAIRSSTWNMTRERSVNFGYVLYYDTLKFMTTKQLLNEVLIREKMPTAITETMDITETMHVIGEMKPKPICVLAGTTTKETIDHYFPDRGKNRDKEHQQDKQFMFNDDLYNNYGYKCPIIAADESQLIGLKLLYSNQLQDSVIIPSPSSQGLTFEPLAPFVAKGDSQWLNILNRVIWATQYAAKNNITPEKIKPLTGPNPNSEINNVMTALALTNTVLAQEYSGFLGIKENSISQEMLPGLEIEADYALQIIGQLGNYEDIFRKNLGEPYESIPLGKQYPRKFNCIWNPLKQPTPPEEALCRLVVPPR